MGALMCRVELNKADGITITVQNDEGKITQTVVMDGTTMILTCKGESDTSTITQVCDGVTVKCKNFTVDSETILLKSTKDTTAEVGGKTAVTSTGDISMSSDAKVATKATGDWTAEGMNLTAEGKTKATLKGTETTVQGTSKATLTAAQAAVNGDAKLDVSSAMIKVASSAMLTLEGQMTSLKGQMTTVSGQMVTLG